MCARVRETSSPPPRAKPAARPCAHPTPRVRPFLLTAARLVVVVEGEVGGAAAHEAADRHGQAQVGAVAVGGGAGVPAALAGRVEHQDVHDVVQVALDDGAVLPAGLVGPLDAALAPVRPVDVVLVLGQPKGVGEVLGDHLALQACRAHARTEGERKSK